MNQAARRIGRTLALVLPVVLVLSGTLAVTRVPWAAPNAESQVLTASSDNASTVATARAPHEVLRDRLLSELQEKNPGVALTHLQEATNGRPSLARHCMDIAKALGQAAVRKYRSAKVANAYSRPVCDTSFATGVAQGH
ncbi:MULTISPECIES: hypothetical protein [Streptomyces]|uniref:Uncharacterized protein n=2 Tax=Streptomyces TaxID=1883 RepID=A0A939FLD0_9ACTN|nr:MULTISPECIES: hypothetical protein [Streptomyces]MBO0652836.1 hypothetical protein [Streptomyces triculaminicus]MBZ6473733.1 hypothetical protein [Streptomyces griseocarneus]QSY51622.1 hypothetical protein J3S04_12575 [Streptomyces griseocarneus]GHG64804.1 membrane protein [Streptomyces griseocarneus]